MSADKDCGLKKETLEMWDELVRVLAIQMKLNSVRCVTISQDESGNVRFVMEPFEESEGGGS